MNVSELCSLSLYLIRSNHTSIGTLAKTIGCSSATLYRVLADRKIPKTRLEPLFAAVNNLLMENGCAAAIECPNWVIPSTTHVITEALARQTVRTMLREPGRTIAFERDGVWPLFLPAPDIVEDELTDNSPFEQITLGHKVDIVLTGSGILDARKKAIDETTQHEFFDTIEGYVDDIGTSSRRIVVIDHVPVTLGPVRSMLCHEQLGCLVWLQGDPMFTSIPSDGIHPGSMSRFVFEQLVRIVENGQFQNDMIRTLEAFRTVR